MTSALLLLLLAPGPADAAFRSRDAGTTAGQFLTLGADARSAGMADAVRAFAEDATALYWDPAGLAGLERAHASFTHGAYYQSVFYDFLAYAQPVRSILGTRERFIKPSQLGSVGVALLYLNAGAINELDNTGAPTGEDFTPQDFAVMTAWGAAITRNLDLGVGVKYISSRIEESAATGAADFAARLHLSFAEMPYTLAGGVQNLGGQLKFISQADPLPLQVFVGNALRLNRNWTLTADVVAPRGARPYPAFGTELRFPFGETIAAQLRAGYQGRTLSKDLDGLAGLAVGGGLSLRHFAFDYAWAPFGLLGDTHRFSLSYGF